MPEDTRQPEALSPDIQDIMRALVSAIRAVKLYPPNNPVYSRSVRKSHAMLERFLAMEPSLSVGVQKGSFTCQRAALGKEVEVNRSIARDMFAKGVREIVISEGVTEEELFVLFRAFALSAEEMAVKNGIASILWEKGATHIKVTEADLEEVITTGTEGGWEDKTPGERSLRDRASLAEKAEAASAGRTLVLGDLMTDPAGFAAGMVELARQTLSESESLEDRLYALYQEAGQKLQVEQPDRKESLFEGLAKSVLSLEPSRRDGFIAGKLYADLDSEIVSERKIELDEQAPNQVHELVTGRYSTTWTVLEVSELLKKATLKKAESASPPPAFPAPEAVPLPGDLADMAKELAVYTEEEMEAIKTMSEEGMESDIIEASVRTLIHLLSLVKDPLRPAPTNTDVELFSRIIHQLEDLLVYLLKNKDYRLASVVTQAFHMPVDPAFKPRMAEALKKTTSRNAIAAMIADMRKNPRGSPEYEAARAYLATVEREATNVLLELLAEEPDRTTRLFILELAKELGKNQIMLLGERLSDDRWYYVRNIVSILGETKTDQAIAFLRKAADHRNVRIRQEVVKGLLSIGGKKAASVLIKFIRDRDASLRMTAIQGIGELSGIGAEEEESFLEFLAELPLNARNRDLTLAAIAAIGRVGSPRAAAFLKRYDRIRWWRSRKLQETLRDAAQQSAEEIMRRTGDGGSSRG